MTREPLQFTTKELLLWIVGKRKRYHVQGSSMEPLFQGSEEVLVKTAKKVSTGDIVVVRHPFKSLLLVKEVGSVLDNGSIIVLGKRSEMSTDSRSFGPVTTERIIGRVTSVLG